MKDMLENARSQHKEIIQVQISETAQLRDAVGITKNLFAMSKVDKFLIIIIVLIIRMLIIIII
jgi:cell division protein FtsL